MKTIALLVLATLAGCSARVEDAPPAPTCEMHGSDSCGNRGLKPYRYACTIEGVEVASTPPDDRCEPDPEDADTAFCCP